jgi:hypothetical protein
MLEVASTSGYGDMETKTTKYDDSVRKAFEIPIEKMDNKFTFDAKRIKLFQQDSVTIKPYKFTIYQEGGFFSKHTDSCTGPDLLGTIVLMMHPAEEGGEFYIGDNLIPLNQKGSWVFLFGDLEHEVKPVIKGTRIALTFKVFCKERERVSKMARKTVDDKIKNIIELIRKYDDKVAFITHHHYGGYAEEEHLKGIDKEFYSALKGEGFKLSLVDANVWSQSILIDSGDSFEVDKDDIEFEDINYNFYPKKVVLPDRIQTTWEEADRNYSGHTGNEASHESVKYISMAIIVKP